MSLLKTAKVQIGKGLNALHNFIFDASPQDGTLTLKRENGQEVMKFGNDGKPTFEQLSKAFGSSGSVELPNGLILKWGRGVFNGASAYSTLGVIFQEPFPTLCASVQATSGAPGVGCAISEGSISTSGCTVTASGVSTATLRWIALGY